MSENSSIRSVPLRRPGSRLAPVPASAAPTTAVEVELVVPVHDEAADLAAGVRRLHTFLRTSFPFRVHITIADNASTDGTLSVAQHLARELPGVDAVHLDAQGRGRALRHVWSRSDAEVLAYMDVDLSTDLAGLHPLVAPLLSGHSDISTGTRLAPSSHVVRGAKREVISRSYNALLHLVLGARFSDAQCGFKAIRRDCARDLLPLVEDSGWFFDTELLFRAQRAGMRIHEVPVDWVDDPESSVHILRTVVDDLKGVRRLAWALRTGQLRRPPAPGAAPAPAPLSAAARVGADATAHLGGAR